jgi:hypothetical protein
MSTESQTIVPSCIPKKQFSRNQHGLICDTSVVYVYRDDGTIDWRRMIKPEFLVPHKQNFIKKGLPVPETTDGLKDTEILILLGGIKDLAKTRGYTQVSHSLTVPNDRYVASVCTITWIGNYETEGRAVSFSSAGDACDLTVNGLGKNFLAAIAENRAFCRAVRNFLNINIVSADEIGGDTSNDPQQEDSVLSLLRATVAQFGVSFETIKRKLIEEKVEGAEKFTALSDIPRYQQLELVARIKQKAAEREADKLKKEAEAASG